MELIAWIESTALAEWVRVSIVGYPMMITAHSVGLAVMVGLAVAIALRVLGWFSGLPYASMRTFFTVAWIGFLVNFLSGVALFSSQAQSYVTNVPFLLKMGFVLAGAATVGALQPAVAKAAEPGGGTFEGAKYAKAVAMISIVMWAGATVTGRLIAYL
jgi:hypothetical protein